MTESIQRLPAVPQPPHDPRSLLIHAQTGWRRLGAVLDHVEESPDDHALALSPKPAAGRPLVDQAGSFGGLAQPTGLAVDAAGGIYLLDAASGQIRRFDPCECRFEDVPCTGGLGSEPRQFLNPHGIEIFCGDLFVCDTGNRRIQVFALKGLTLRNIWGPFRLVRENDREHLERAVPAWSSADGFGECEPRRELIFPEGTWEPYDIAFNRQGHAFVTDHANGVIHRFDRRGRWLNAFGQLVQPTHLAIDARGWLYVVQEGVVQKGTSEVAVFDAEGTSRAPVARADTASAHFCPTGIATDAAGNLYLADRCHLHRFRCEPDSPPVHSGTSPVPMGAHGLAFDPQGHLLVLSPENHQALQFPITAFEPQGEWLSQPLDSEIYQCQWHRVLLHGEIPDGASVQIATFTAEIPLTPGDLPDLDDHVAWCVSPKATAVGKGGWDCLIRSRPGRYLCLRLQLRGNGAMTPRLDRVRLFYPRISLRRYLPAAFAGNPVSADFTDRFLGIFDTLYRSIEDQVDRFARYLDPMATPATRRVPGETDFLTWIGSWIGIESDRIWDPSRRRRLLREAHRLYQWRGTVEGLRRLLLLFLGWEPRSRGGYACGCSTRPVTSRQCHPSKVSCDCHPPLPPLILEHFKLRRWLFVSEGRLGDQSVLWGQRIVNRTQLNESAQVGGTQLITKGDPLGDPFRVYAHKFSVFIPAACARTKAKRAALQRLIAQQKPAHTVAQLELVEPRFRVGFQASIGLDSVVGRYPDGFTLNDQPLGRATVLAKGSLRGGAPTLEIGDSSRIGTTTILD